MDSFSGKLFCEICNFQKRCGVFHESPHHFEERSRFPIPSLMLDFRFALRQLLKTPVVTIVAILALALGIGVNTAIFSLVYGVLLRPLPFPNQEQLVYLSEWSEQVPGMSVSYPNYVDFRARQQSFSALGAARNQG